MGWRERSRWCWVTGRTCHFPCRPLSRSSLGPGEGLGARWSLISRSAGRGSRELGRLQQGNPRGLPGGGRPGLRRGRDRGGGECLACDLPQAKSHGPFLPLTEASIDFVFTHFFFLRVHLLTLSQAPSRPIHSFSKAQSQPGCPLFPVTTLV